MSKLQQLPGGWERLADGIGTPAYHNPVTNEALYVKIYRMAQHLDVDHEYSAIAYPEGTDIGERNKLGVADTLEGAEQLAKDWIEEYAG